MLYQSLAKLPNNIDCLVVGVMNNIIVKTNIMPDELIDELQNFLNKKQKMSSLGNAYLLLHQINYQNINKVLLLNIDIDNHANLGENILQITNNNEINSLDFVIDFDNNLPRKIIKDIEYQTYQYTTTLTKKIDSVILEKITFYGDVKKIDTIIKNNTAIAHGVNFARQLANLPANYCTPSDLAKEALSLNNHKIKVSVMGESEMEKLKMGSLLSVSKGSQTEAKLITLEHYVNTTEQPLVLIGKGVTFDTGGISLKPGAKMDEMKFDMCGAASVLGVFKALSLLDLPINVVGVIPSSENMPSGKATKPGDVVTSMSGKTIEILNTDAEGRLILCDALTYVEKFQPKRVIDIATLTGAVIIALGNNISGLMSNNDKFANELLKAGIESDDKLWRLPLADYDEAYDELLDSNFADIANIGGRSAGTITAGCFLARFANKYQWAHLDIAGTAWKEGKDKGATGRPVNLLMQYLFNTLSINKSD